MKPLKDWDELPDFMRTEEVRPYYDTLKDHEKELYLKRAFDVIASSILLVFLGPVMLAIAIWIKLDSPGPIFFRQERITQYGRMFRIFKFRTMVNHAEKMGSAVTVANDTRITKVGSIIRQFRLDEFPQLLNVLVGDMSFVGTRPEVEKYVLEYTEEMNATLLLPAGITSEASIKFKDENRILNNATNIDEVYVNDVLPVKMSYNLKSLTDFSLKTEFSIMYKTLIAVLE